MGTYKGLKTFMGSIICQCCESNSNPAAVVAHIGATRHYLCRECDAFARNVTGLTGENYSSDPKPFPTGE
jgi:hypothetical protein